ncbi:hypothetical protein [Roseovarius sp. D0-M9]
MNTLDKLSTYLEAIARAETLEDAQRDARMALQVYKKSPEANRKVLIRK